MIRLLPALLAALLAAACGGIVVGGADGAEGDAVEAGVAACVPSCAGRTCGDDGCGGACGECPSAQRCDGARCVPRATGCTPFSVRWCYGGPVRTEGVGVCRQGVVRCSYDGVWLPGCFGEVRPSPEVCGNGADDNCDGAVDDGCPAPRCDADLGSALGPRVATGSTAGAGALVGSCGGAGAPERAFVWRAPRLGAYTFDTVGSSFNTVLHVRDGGCVGRELACNDDTLSGLVLRSTVTLDLAAGQVVALIVDGSGVEQGDFTLNITAGGPERCTPDEQRPCYTGPAGTAGVGRCREGTLACHGAGVWGEACAGSVVPDVEVCGNGVDDDCDGARDEGCDAAVATRVFTGRVSYDRRGPDARRVDWGPVEEVVAPGFAVRSMHGDVQVDAAVTDAAGRFSLRVPEVTTADDRVVVSALQSDGAGAIEFAVAAPGLAAGMYDPAVEHAGAPRVWSWSWRVDAMPAGGPVHITEADGSGAARLFDLGRRAFELPRRVLGRRGATLVAWFEPGVTWPCTACFLTRPRRAFAQDFATQIVLNGDRDDQQWWADGVVAHEVGHWAMASHGVSPGEGGPHTLNDPLTAGMAWSEGYAHWHAASTRGDPLFVDRQRGTMFWFDMAARRSLWEWEGADPAMGLLDPITENEVAAIVWGLAPRDPSPILTALASPRMTRAPFARGYTNRRGVSVPVLPDLLDALVCASFPRATLAAALDLYPYRPDTARCPSDLSPPVTASWHLARGVTSVDGVTRATLTATVTRAARLEAPVQVTLRLPAGARLEAGARSWVSPADVGSDTHAITLAWEATPADDLVLAFDAPGVAQGARGEVPWRFGRPAPAAPLPVARGAPLVVEGRDLGATIEVTLRGHRSTITTDGFRRAGQ